jgi:hypothetical protein
VPLYNYWLPLFRLLDKAQLPDRRYRKVYEKAPAIPYERLPVSPDVSENPRKLERRLWHDFGWVLVSGQPPLYDGIN